MKKANIAFMFILILVALAIVVSLFFPDLFSLVGIGQSYTLKTEDAIITFHTADKYWDITGCQKMPNLGACSSSLVEIGKESSCPLYNAYVTGFYNCDSAGYTSNCAYGEVCDFTSVWGKRCDDHCNWGEQKLPSVYGGALYSDFDNCAWYVEVKDLNNNLIKEFSANTKYENWKKDQFYRDPISIQFKDTYLNYVSDDYGVVQRRNDGSTIKGCRAVRFDVLDPKYSYEVCLGNDNIAEPLCEDVLKKTCRVQCPLGKEIDTSSCECVDNAAEVSDVEFEDITPKCDFSCWLNKIIEWVKSLFS